MQVYSFTLALRFWHPSIAPGAITAQLRIEPSHTSQAGQPRFTPKGAPLEGVYRESYWHAEPLWQGWRESTLVDAESSVLELLHRLVPHREFIQHLIVTGGRGVIQVSSHGLGNYALVLSSELLAQCSGLGLSFAHDVYGTSQA